VAAVKLTLEHELAALRTKVEKQMELIVKLDLQCKSQQKAIRALQRQKN
jgi:hypothetical protein